MKKKCVLLALCILVLTGVSVAHAAVYNFIPKPADMGDLEHTYYFSWNIYASGLRGADVTSAQLTFSNIWDWTVEPDMLYVHLLDVPQTSGQLVRFNSYPTYWSTLYRFNDNELTSGDDWAGNPLLGTWTDPMGGQATNFNLVIDFDENQLQALENSVADGNFAIGVDPDCHYYNSGVTLTVTTAPVPEPATMSLLGMGVLGLLGLKRRKA